MKRALILVVAACGASDTHGRSATEYAGALNVAFTNATPERMCTLLLTFDDDSSWGDNWLPDAGLPTGQSLAWKIKPGKYKAQWSTCHDAKEIHTQKLVASYAGTLVHQTAVELKDPTQLFAFIADTTPPTSRAPVMAHYKVVRFEGHAVVQSETQSSE